MRLRYRQTGGFVPIFRGCDLDTATLSGADAKRLETLVLDSGLDDPPMIPHLRGADTRLHTLRIERDGLGARTIAVDELQVWPNLRPLLAFLQEASVDLLPED